MAAYSLRHHMERAHGRVFPQVRVVDFGGGGLEVYKVSFPQILNLVDCPEEGFTAKAKPLVRLREHFYFLSLEIKGDHISGGTGTVTVV